jgi:hypothetical protein
MLPDLAPGSELDEATSIQRPNWLPGLHRAGPSTPLDESRACYSDSAKMVTWVEGFVNCSTSKGLDWIPLMSSVLADETMAVLAKVLIPWVNDLDRQVQVKLVRVVRIWRTDSGWDILGARLWPRDFRSKR